MLLFILLFSAKGKNDDYSIWAQIIYYKFFGKKSSFGFFFLFKAFVFFKKIFILLFYLYEYFACIHVYVPYVCLVPTEVWRGCQLHPGTVVIHHVGAGNWTKVFWKKSSDFTSPSSLAPAFGSSFSQVHVCAYVHMGTISDSPGAGTTGRCELHDVDAALLAF